MTPELIVTVIGWLVVGGFQFALLTHQAKMQQQLTLLREVFDTARETRSYLVPGKLTMLDQAFRWFAEAETHFTAAAALHQVNGLSPDFFSQKASEVRNAWFEWASTRGGVLFYWAIANDKTPLSPQPWDPNTQPIPSDLSGLILAAKSLVNPVIQLPGQTPLSAGMLDKNMRLLAAVSLKAIEAINRMTVSLTHDEPKRDDK